MIKNLNPQPYQGSLVVPYRCAHATVKFRNQIPAGVNRQSHELGIANCEPIIIMLDALYQYAAAYKKRYDSTLSTDYVLSVGWLDAMRGLKVLFDGDGALAMANDISTDTKDNGACDKMFWAAMTIAGYKEDDLSNSFCD